MRGKQMKDKILLAVALTIITITTSCNSNPLETPIAPGRRDYTWTVDTINPGYDYASLGRIWGSSPTDVWAVGDGNALFRMFYYDGYKWTSYYKEPTNPLEIIGPTSIWGTAKNNVWMASRNSTIWRWYDGKQWTLYGEYKVEGYDRLIINNFDGISSNDIYGVGFADNSNNYEAIIMRYDGTNWKLINIPETKVSIETIAIEPNSGVLVISGTVYDPSGFVAKIYYWDGKELKELLSDYGWSFVTKLNNNEIFATLGRKIYKYSNKQLTLWKDNTGTEINGNIVCGRSRNDFFIGGAGGLLHYNGTDFTTIYKTDLAIRRGIIFEKDVFFIGIDELGNMKNYIIHGQLK